MDISDLCLKDKTDHEHVAESERNPENDKKLIEMQTFLLAYLTAKVSLLCAVFLKTKPL